PASLATEALADVQHLQARSEAGGESPALLERLSGDRREIGSDQDDLVGHSALQGDVGERGDLAPRQARGRPGSNAVSDVINESWRVRSVKHARTILGHDATPSPSETGE